MSEGTEWEAVCKQFAEAHREYIEILGKTGSCFDPEQRRALELAQAKAVEARSREAAFKAAKGTH
jgi:hypothetical protein